MQFESISKIFCHSAAADTTCQNSNIDENTFCTKEFNASIRCATPVVSSSLNFWTAEKVQFIAVRDGVSAEVLKVIDNPGGGLVNCLVQVSSETVWAGLCTGVLNIYSSRTYMLLKEIKNAHKGAIRALETSSVPSDTPEYEHHVAVVLSASEDWSIGIWDSVAATQLGRFLGHTNGVRCLAVFTNSLNVVSGGNDGCIRLWSLQTVSEITHETVRASMFPTSAHQGASVLCILTTSKYFISCGADGSAHAFVADERGSWIKQVDHRDSSITQAIHDTSQGRLWIAALDGTVRCFSDVAPDFVFLTAFTDVRTVPIVLLVSLSNRCLHDAWTLDDCGVLSQYTESLSDSEVQHPAFSECERINNTELVSVLKRLKELKVQAIRNYTMIQECTSGSDNVRITTANVFCRNVVSFLRYKLLERYFYWWGNFARKRQRCRHLSGAILKLRAALMIKLLLHYFKKWFLRIYFVRILAMRRRIDANNVKLKHLIREEISYGRISFLKMELVNRKLSVISFFARYAQTSLVRKFFLKWQSRANFFNNRLSREMKTAMQIVEHMRDDQLARNTFFTWGKWRSLRLIQHREAAFITLHNKILFMSKVFSYWKIWILFHRKLKSRKPDNSTDNVKCLVHMHYAKKDILAHFSFLPLIRCFFFVWYNFALRRRSMVISQLETSFRREVTSWEEVLNKQINYVDLNKEIASLRLEIKDRKLDLTAIKYHSYEQQQLFHTLERDAALAEIGFLCADEEVKNETNIFLALNALISYLKESLLNASIFFSLSLSLKKDIFGVTDVETRKSDEKDIKKGAKLVSKQEVTFETGVFEFKKTLFEIADQNALSENLFYRRGSEFTKGTPSFQSVNRQHSRSSWRLSSAFFSSLNKSQRADILEKLLCLIYLYDMQMASGKRKRSLNAKNKVKIFNRSVAEQCIDNAHIFIDCVMGISLN